MINMDEKLKELKAVAQEYERILSVSILEDAPFIVEVGALTVTTDSNNKVTLQRTYYPTQFTKKAVQKIKECEFKNSQGKVEPVVYPRVQWYRKELESIKKTIEIFSN